MLGETTGLASKHRARAPPLALTGVRNQWAELRWGCPCLLLTVLGLVEFKAGEMGGGHHGRPIWPTWTGRKEDGLL